MGADPVRDAAVDVLFRVFERGAFLSDSLDKTLRRKNLPERGRRFLTQLVYGTVRYRLLLEHAVRPLLHQPFEDLPPAIRIVLRMGVFQALFCEQVPFPVMVHTSVELAKKRGHAGTARLVNAVLKRVPHSLDEVTLPDAGAAPAEYLGLRYSMPAWLASRWVEDHGFEAAEAMCRASVEQAPVTIRVNTARVGVEELLDRLRRHGVAAEKRTPVPEEVTLLDGAPPARTKRFAQGEYFVQDPASMLAAHLLEPERGEWILDMCAAPGGKATHLDPLTGGEARVVAMDASLARMGQLTENIERLGARGIRAVCGDGAAAPFAAEFDRVLLDAPCTGLGTLRRHPDLKGRAGPRDPEELAETQRRLLRSAIGLCKNRGVVVYSVCTFTREETDGVIGAIVRQEPVELEDGPIWMDRWKTGTGTYRTAPQADGLDGFFLTRLRKRS